MEPHHHKGNKFINPSPEFEDHSFWAVIKWRWKRLFEKLPSLDPEDYHLAISPNDGVLLAKNNPHLSLTWVGHATVYIQLDGKGILTDPIWSDRASPFSHMGPKRYTKPGIAIEDLPYLHYVVISHNHYDHLDLPTLKQLEQKFHPVFLTGLGNKPKLIDNKIKNVVELDWWQSWKKEDISFTFTPTQHFSARTPWDKNETLWGSFVISGSKNIYFAGDTGYFGGFKEIGKKFPIHCAILPIGAYEPRWFMKSVHLNPQESVVAFQDLGATYMLPIHYQTFVLSDEAIDAPLKETFSHFSTSGISKNRIVDLSIGETRFFKE